MKKWLARLMIGLGALFLVGSGWVQVGIFAGAGHGPYWPIKVFDLYLGSENLRQSVFIQWLNSFWIQPWMALWITMIVGAVLRRSKPARIAFGAALLWVSIMSVSGVIRSDYMSRSDHTPYIYYLKAWTILLLAYLSWLWFLLLFRSKAQVYDDRRNPV